jgi:hypothetical protein
MNFLPHVERAGHKARDIMDPVTAAIEQIAITRVLGSDSATSIPLTGAIRNLERAAKIINEARDALVMAQGRKLVDHANQGAPVDGIPPVARGNVKPFPPRVVASSHQPVRDYVGDDGPSAA